MRLSLKPPILKPGGPLHKILQLQIERFIEQHRPATAEDYTALFEAISHTYRHFDEDRERFERGLLESSEELEQTNHHLREERDQGNAILSSMGEGLIVLDTQRRVQLMNPVAERLLAVKADQVRGKQADSLYRVFRQDQELKAEERPSFATLRTGKPVLVYLEDEISFQNSRGQHFPVAISTSPVLKNGKIDGVVIVFRDITEEQKAKQIVEEEIVERTEEVEERRAQLQASIKNLGVGFVMVDEQLSIIMINVAAVKVFASQMSDASPAAPHKLAVGLKLSDIDTVLNSEQVHLKTECEKCLHTQRRTEFKNITFGELYVHFYLSPIIVNTKSIGVAIIVEDTTEARLLERSKDEFFSIASHELRTPLSAIRGNTAMMKQYYSRLTKKDMMEMIGDIHDSSIRLIEMVGDFLDLSRLQQGKIKFSQETFKIKPVIDEVIEELSATAKPQNLYLKVTGGADKVPAVLGDRNRVKQVLINLVGNSIKFTDKGGVTVTASRAGKLAEVSVTDTGHGLSPESQKLLFRKFQQTGDNILTRDTTRGTGLGLYISRLLTEGMGGTIYLVDSEVSKGSTFAFTLPLSTKRVGSKAPAEATGLLERMKIDPASRYRSV